MTTVNPTLLQLLDALSEVSANWYTLGLRLDLSAGTLNAIKATNHDKVDDCMNDMLQKWLGKYPDRGWSDVVTALRSMERNDVAKKLATKYSSLGSGDVLIVLKSITDVASNWKRIGGLLGIDDGTLTAISNNNSASADKCLIDMVTCWLQYNYDTLRHGLPTWEKLVQVIDSPAGGNNSALALTIAQQHNVSIQQPTQVHIAQGGYVSQQSNSVLSPLVNNPSPLSYTSSPSHSIGMSVDSSQPVLSGAVVTGTPYVTLHPPVKPLCPNLAYIEDELDKVINHFESNSYKTRNCFKSSDMPVYDVCTYIRTRKKLYFKSTKIKAAKELNQLIRQITSYDSLFDLLESYVSWFNYEIFASLARMFLENDKQLQIAWTSYEDKIKEYFSLGKGVRVVSSPTIQGLPEAVGTKVMVLKVEQEDHVHNDIALFRKAVAKALNQSDFCLYLCTIATGCVELRFVIPDFLFDEIFPLTSRQINITLPNLGITAIYCDTYRVKLPPVSTPPSAYVLYHSYAQSALSEFHNQLKIENNSSSLHDACYRGSLSEVQWIIQKFGYVKYERGHHGWTPLHSAAYGSHLDVLCYLIDNKCDPNISDDDDVTLLHVSSYKGHINIVTYLIDTHNVLVDAIDCYNTTAVMYATLGGQDEVLHLLISKYHCDTSACSRAGHSLSLLACQSGQKKVIDTLESLQLFNPQSSDNKGRGIIHYTCAGDSVDILEYLIRHYNLELTVQDNEGKTGLHIAAMYSSTNVVKYIIGKIGIHAILEVDSYTNNPLFYACHGVIEVNCSMTFAKLITPITSKNIFPFTSNNAIKASEILVSWMLEQCTKISYFNINAKFHNGRTLVHAVCTSGSISLMKVLEQYNANINVLDNDGESALHRAALAGSLTLFKYLVKCHHLDPSGKSHKGMIALHHAGTSGNVNMVEYLADISDVKCQDHDGKNVLHKACHSGNAHLVEYLIVHKAMDSSITDNRGLTLLHHAAMSDNVSLVKELVDKYQLNPYQSNIQGRLPVHLATQNGCTTIVRYFIVDKAMDASVTDNEGLTLLHHAAMSDNVSLVKELVDKYQLNPYQSDIKGHLPIHAAARKGCTTIVRYFIEDKAMEASATDNEGLTLLHHAAMSDNVSLVKELVDKYQLNPYQSNITGYLPIHAAAQKGRATIVRYFIVDKAMDASVTDNEGLTLLHHAAASDNVSLVKELVDKYHLNPYQCDIKGHLPIHAAAQKGCTNIVRYFISQCHVNIAIQAMYGYNVVHFSTISGHYHTTEYLNTVYINGFSVPDNDGILPIHTACQSGNIQLVEYLVDVVGCDIKSLTNSHQSCAVFACISGNLDLLRLLVAKYSLDLTVTDRDGFTLLHYAAEKGHNHIIEWLVEEHKLDPRCKSNNAITILHKAASGGDANTVKYLYETYSLDINSATKTNKYTPLHSATVKGHIPVVQYLTELPQCKVTAKDSDGSTVLHLSSRYGYIKLLQHYMENHIVLLEKGNLYNSRNLTPLDVGCIYGNLPIVQYLVEDSQLNQDMKDVNKNINVFYYAVLLGHCDIMYYLFKKVNSALVPFYIAIRGINGNTPCHVACSSGNVDMVKSFTEAAFHINDSLLLEPNDKGYNILHFASNSGSLPVVEHLTKAIFQIPNIPIDFGCETVIFSYSTEFEGLFEDKTVENLTPLYLGCFKGHIEIVELLATICPSTISMVDNNGRGLMHAAAHSTNVKLIEYLAERHQFKSDTSDKTGVTPLHIAAKFGNFNSFKALVNCTGKSGNYNPVSHDGKTPFYLACENGHILIASYLADDLKVSIDVLSTTKTTYTPLHVAASNNKIATVQLLVEKFSADVNCTLHDDNSTPLHLATIKGHVAVVLYLTRLPQCNVTATLTDGSTVLHLSSKHGHYHLVKHFVKYHRQLLTLYDNSNMTPLHYACREGHLSIVQCLIEQGHSDTAIQDNDGHTCYHRAVFRNQIDVVKYLVSLDNSIVSLAIADNSNNTSLHIACSSDNLEMVQILVNAVITKKPSILSITNSNGCNIIHCASNRCNISIMEFLIACLKSKVLLYLFEARNNLGQTPLHLSCIAGQVEVVKSLATLCPSTISMVDNNGRGLMHAASAANTLSETGSFEIIKYMANEQNLSCDTPDKWDITPIHMLMLIAAIRKLSSY